MEQRLAKPIPVGSARQHGTRSTYVYGCRCEDCTAANAEYQRIATKTRTNLKKTPGHVHGTKNGYTNWGCRCDRCVEAARVHWRNWHERRRLK